MSKQKQVILFVLGAVAGVSLTAMVAAAPARASLFQDFWSNITAPFTAASPAAVTAQSSTSMPPYAPTTDYEASIINAVKKASPAVVSITISKNVPVIENCVQNPFGNLPPDFGQFFGQMPQFSVPCTNGSTKLQQVGGGSGFIVSSDGLILTNKHVVSDTSASYTVLTNDGKQYEAKVLARDPVQDLAIIKIDATGLPTVNLGDSSGVQLGQTAIAIGNALGEYRNTVSVGVISGLARTVTAGNPDTGAPETIQGVLQTDAAINPGNSGGPLLNSRGEVIGIDTAVAEQAQNIGFAIPINQAKRDIDSVRTTGKITAPFLGVRYTEVTPALQKSDHLPVDYGALIRGSSSGPAVEPGSPAAKAGLQAEDIILGVNGQKIDQDHFLGNVISQFKVGDKIALKVNRNGKELTIPVTLGERPAGQ